MRGETSLSTFAAICRRASSLRWGLTPASNNNTSSDEEMGIPARDVGFAACMVAVESGTLLYVELRFQALVGTLIVFESQCSFTLSTSTSLRDDLVKP